MAKLHRAVLSTSVIMALTILGDSLLYPIFPLYAEQLGVPLVLAGLVLSINRWVRLYSNYLAAKVYSSRSVYVPVLLASMGATLSTAFYAFPVGIVGFLLARMLWGVCFSFFRMGSYLVVLQTSQPVLGWALGLSQAILRLGSAFTALVGGYLIDLMGYHWTMLLMAHLSGFAIPLSQQLKRQLSSESVGLSEAAETVQTQVTARGQALSRGFCYAAAFITHLVANGLVSSSLALLLRETIGNGISVGSLTLGIATISGFVFSSHWLSAIVLSAWSGGLSDTYGRQVPFVAVTALQGSLLLLLVQASQPVVCIVSAILFFVSANMQKVFLDAALGDTTDTDNRRIVTARYNSLQDLGAALGPLIGYGLGALSGFNTVYNLGALVLLSTAAVPLLNQFWLRGRSVRP